MMSNWQQHEGATRLMLWLLFKVRLGKQQRLTVLTLMKVAYGEDRVQQATLNPQERKRLIHTFESDLEALHHYGLKPIFDEVTYPRSIQPMWAKLSEVPEDPEAALDFWIEDAGRKVSVTDSGQRGKWAHLCQARLLFDQLPADWNSQTLEKRKPGRKSRRSQPQESGCGIWSGEQILRARQRLNLSQRELADRLGKSQSWIRDVEKGRFRVKAEEQLRLQAVLGMS
jgi:DNA-binding transcriptional regulator YiaG